MFDQSNNTDAIDMKIDESALEEKSSFNMLALSFSSKLYWALLIWILDHFLNFSSLLNYIISVDKTASKKIGALICSMKFFSPEVALHLLNLPYSLAQNTAAVSGLVS